MAEDLALDPSLNPTPTDVPEVAADPFASSDYADESQH